MADYAPNCGYEVEATARLLGGKWTLLIFIIWLKASSGLVNWRSCWGSTRGRSLTASANSRQQVCYTAKATQRYPLAWNTA